MNCAGITRLHPPATIDHSSKLAARRSRSMSNRSLIIATHLDRSLFIFVSVVSGYIVLIQSSKLYCCINKIMSNTKL